MSVRKLGLDNQPLRDRSTRSPRTRRVLGEQLYLFEIRYDAPANGARRQRRKRLWLPDSTAAEAAERELRGDDPLDRLTWQEAWEKFQAAHLGKRADGHLANMAHDVKVLCEHLGNLAVEATTLAQYSDFLRWREKQSSARAAQLARAHTLRIARWVRAHGLVEALPFETAPVPEWILHRRSAATPEQWLAVADVLRLTMRPLWLALGYTGARITGMARLLERDVDENQITVTTKGRKRMSYALLPPLRSAIEEAREFKRTQGITSDYVFTTTMGSPWNHCNFNTALRRILRAHPKLQPITPHQLRHMWATLAAAANFSPDYLQAGLGHDDRRSAEQYVHHTREMADTVAATVSDTLMTHFEGRASAGSPRVSDGFRSSLSRKLLAEPLADAPDSLVLETEKPQAL